MVEDTILYLLHNLFFGEAFHWVFQYITFKLTFSLSFSQYFSLFIKFFSISWIIPVIYSAIYLYFPGLQFILVFSYFIQMLFHVFFDFFFNSSNMFITVFWNRCLSKLIQLGTITTWFVVFSSYILSFIQVSRFGLLVMSFDMNFWAIISESSGGVTGYPKVLELGEQISLTRIPWITKDSVLRQWGGQSGDLVRVELKQVALLPFLWEAAAYPKSKWGEELPCHRAEGTNRIPGQGKAEGGW